MLGSLTRFLFFIGVISLLGLSCSATPAHELDAAGGGGGSMVGAGGAPVSSTSADVSLGGSLDCALTCSADGKATVDCHGAVVTCPAMESCAAGECKDPCKAAIELRSSVGCSYYAVDMDGYSAADGGCFAVFVANTFDYPAHLSFDFAGAPIDLAQFAKIPKGSGKSLVYGPYNVAAGLAPGEVAIVFLAGQGLCPVPSATPSGAQLLGTGLSKAFHFTSDVPVVGYQMLPYGGGSAAVTGASLLLPTSAWDTNYIAVNAYAASPIAATSPSLDIVATEDGTTVTFLPKVAIVGGNGVASAPANAPVTYNLDAGQVLQITQTEELTGSPIQSNKPIGFWGGHPCMTIPVDKYACDHAEQQIPPVRALGSSYAAVSYRQRSTVKENPPWRIIGAVAGTKLTFDPAIPGAPAGVDLGSVAEFKTYAPFTVKSQDKDHPFVLVTYMTGEETVDEYFGDSDFVRMVPTNQYLSRYVFFTDPTYSETNLVAVRQKGKTGFVDVKLDCAGTLKNWAPIGSSGELEFTRIDLVTGDFAPQNGCDNGRHEISSDAPFGLWVWGWGTPQAGTESVSYGYPAGEGVSRVNDVVVPPVPK